MPLKIAPTSILEPAVIPPSVGRVPIPSSLPPSNVGTRAATLTLADMANNFPSMSIKTMEEEEALQAELQELRAFKAAHADPSALEERAFEAAHAEPSAVELGAAAREAGIVT